MNIRLIAIALLAVSSAAHAQDSCGLRAAQLLSAGDTAELAALFKASNSGTRAQVADLAARAGKLTELSEAGGPRFSQHVRYSALSPDLPTSFGFKSFRVNAVSPHLGLVQLHVAVEPSAECTILAIHLEVDSKVKVASVKDHQLAQSQSG